MCWKHSSTAICSPSSSSKVCDVLCHTRGGRLFLPAIWIFLSINFGCRCSAVYAWMRRKESWGRKRAFTICMTIYLMLSCSYKHISANTNSSLHKNRRNLSKLCVSFCCVKYLYGICHCEIFQLCRNHCKIYTLAVPWWYAREFQLILFWSYDCNFIKTSFRINQILIKIKNNGDDEITEEKLAHYIYVYLNWRYTLWYSVK